MSDGDLVERVKQIRAGLGHPVIDADGHYVEYAPALATFLAEEGIADVIELYADASCGTGTLAVERLPEEARNRGQAVRGPWWAIPADNARDIATAMAPGLLYERLDDSSGLEARMSVDDRVEVRIADEDHFDAFVRRGCRELDLRVMQPCGDECWVASDGDEPCGGEVDHHRLVAGRADGHDARCDTTAAAIEGGGVTVGDPVAGVVARFESVRGVRECRVEEHFNAPIVPMTHREDLGVGMGQRRRQRIEGTTDVRQDGRVCGVAEVCFHASRGWRRWCRWLTVSASCEARDGQDGEQSSGHRRTDPENVGLADGVGRRGAVVERRRRWLGRGGMRR